MLNTELEEIVPFEDELQRKKNQMTMTDAGNCMCTHDRIARAPKEKENDAT